MGQSNSTTVGVKIVSVYCLLIGVGSLLLAVQGSPLHWILTPVSFAAAYGLWTLSLRGLVAAMVLFFVEALRGGIDVLGGDTGAMITVVLSLLLTIYLYSQRNRFE